MQGYEVTQSSTAYPLVFLLIDSADHISPKTGLTPTVTVSKNGAAFAAPAGAVAEIGNGWYKVAGNATDTATLGPLLLHATAAGADPVDVVFPIVAVNPQNANLGLTNLDATISSRSTYAGGDTAGTTTLLTRLTATRATGLDNLDAAISTRSTYAGGDTAGTTTLLARLTAIRAGNLDNLDATISSRLATSGFAAAPTAAVVATTVWQSLTGTANFSLANSIGQLLVSNIDTNIGSRSTYAGGPVASVAGDVAGNVGGNVLGTVLGVVTIDQGAKLPAPRDYGSTPDGAMSIGDALWASACGAVGQESVVGTAYYVRTPAGTIVRQFVIDSPTAPTSRT